MSKFKKVIYIDVDSTLVEVMPRIRYIYDNYYRKENGAYADPNNNSWNMGLPKEIIEDIFALDTFYNTLKPTKECSSALKELKKMGFKIIAFSKTSYGNTSSKARMLKRECSEYIDDFIFCSLGLDKGNWDMEGCFFLEDSPNNFINSNALYNILVQTYGKKGWQKDYKGKKMSKWEELVPIVKRALEYENLLTTLV